MTQQPPVAARIEHHRIHHGRDFLDHYEWMRDKDNPATIAYLEAENAYTEAHTAHLQDLQEVLFAEIKSRVKETDMSVPVRRGDYWYFARTAEGKAYAASCRVHAPLTGELSDWTPPELLEDTPLPGEEVLLDLNELAEGHDFFALGASSLSHDATHLAYSVDTQGDERFTLRVKNLTTGELLPDVLENISYGAVFSSCGTYLFYTTMDEAWRPDRIWRHTLGTDRSADELVFHEPDEGFWVGIGTSRSEKYLIIETASKLTSEVWTLEASDPTGVFRCVLPREEGIEYSVDHLVVAGEDRFVVTHNRDGVNFSVGIAAVDALHSLDDLEELIAHSDEVRIEGIDCFADFIGVVYRRGALPRLGLAQITDHVGEVTEFSFDEELYSVSSAGNAEFATPVLRISYGSYTNPGAVIDVVVATGEQIVRKQREILGDYNPADYVATQLWATADDGTLVPMSVLRRRGVAKPEGDESAAGFVPTPTLLYGYGSYEASRDPSVSIPLLSLLDRGVCFVTAHVRGGGEMGRRWYDEGKQLAKKNTFTDFLACADALVAEGMTTPQLLAAEGGSAGGLLMGAIANLAPEKFCAIQATVPFVDALTSMLMPELPLTVTEWEEWGNPYADPEVYDYMASYAPYDNVADRPYPAILALTGLNDTRVLYVEPAKWIAKLRHDAPNGGPYLLKTNLDAGHGGKSGRYEQWRETAFENAWLLDALGVAGVTPTPATPVE